MNQPNEWQALQAQAHAAGYALSVTRLDPDRPDFAITMSLEGGRDMACLRAPAGTRRHWNLMHYTPDAPKLSAQRYLRGSDALADAIDFANTALKLEEA